MTNFQNKKLHTFILHIIMERLTGLLGIALILGVAFLLSNNRKAINLRTIGVGLTFQVFLAFFILNTQTGQSIFGWLGKAVTKVLKFSDEGANFVFGPLASEPLVQKAFGAGGFIFFFKIIPTIIFVAALVNIFYQLDLGIFILGTYNLLKKIVKSIVGIFVKNEKYTFNEGIVPFFTNCYHKEVPHVGVLPAIVEILADIMKKIMGVSGTEALSNISSAFVGQVEAQIMIKPYLKSMTNSELMASMAGSFACISGGVMAAYIGMGVPAQYLIASSIMAAPGALVIAKIMHPETENSQNQGNVKLKIEKQFSNMVDAISTGCSDGLKIGLNVMAMLVGFLAIIALLNFLLAKTGGSINSILYACNLNNHPWGWDPCTLSLGQILGTLFSGFAWAMGVPQDEIFSAGAFMGTKLVANEFVAYLDFSRYLPSTDPNVVKDVLLVNGHELSKKTIAIVSFALCGFANFGSVGIQIGGISALEPSRRTDIAKLAFRALIGGTLASYLSATLAGILLN